MNADRRRTLLAVAVASAGIALFTGTAHSASTAANFSAAEDARRAPIPAGREGAIVAYGRDLLTKTPLLMSAYVRAGMSCEACHVDAGRKAHAGSLLGIYATFPQWNARSHRFIALQDRLAECFLYSMNGRPPAYDSREMIALTAYIAFLSRGAPVGGGFRGEGLIAVPAPAPPRIAAGAIVYRRQCMVCHGARGEGNGGAPPLWGARSFNAGAGMHRLRTMSAFVRYNMPYGSPPNTLSAQEATDVSAYVLSQSRPAFDGTRLIVFPSQPAMHF